MDAALGRRYELVHICRNSNVGQIKGKEEGGESKVDFY